jgi:hypothetical protein
MTVQRRVLLVTLLAPLVALLNSCANITPASPQEQSLAQSYTPPSGKALLYVYRPSSALRQEAKHVVINQKSIGITGSGTFLVTALSPGKYRISAGGELIELQVVAGRNYFIKQAPESEYLGNSVSTVIPGSGILRVESPSQFFSASLVSEAQGRKEVAECIQATAVSQ